MEHAWLEVSLDVLRENVRSMLGHLGSGCGLLAVVKCNAYGHGLVECARTFLDAGAWGVAVGGVREVEELYSSGVRGRVLNLSPVADVECAARVAACGARQSVGSVREAEMVETAARDAGESVPVHIEVDTGLSRLGIPAESAVHDIGRIASFPHIEVEGIYSCLAEVDDGFSMKQRERLTGVVERARAFTGEPLVHIASSSGIHMPEMRMDMVRVGAALYGVDAPAGSGLAPALALRCRVLSLRGLPAGTPVGYGGLHITRSRTSIATLGAGWVEGVPRSLSGRGRVIVKGRVYPMVGRISANHTMVDVGEASIRPGDTATIFGDDGGERISVEDMASLAGTSPYEVLFRLNPEMRRVYTGI